LDKEIFVAGKGDRDVICCPEATSTIIINEHNSIL
jgi:hypothetical protein